jgi:Smg protein
MKESVLDVLVYLYQNYFQSAPDQVHDRDQLTQDLVDAGFDGEQVERAFAWLLELQEALTQPQETLQLGPVRVYSDEEQDRLGVDGVSFLMRLESQGQIDARVREQVLERVAALDEDSIEVDELKWVVLLVLFNRSDEAVDHRLLEAQLVGQKPRLH